jgi:hypothetical protein
MALSIRDVIPVAVGSRQASVVIVEIRYADGEPELYLVPLAMMSLNEAAPIIETTPRAAVGRVAAPDGV